MALHPSPLLTCSRFLVSIKTSRPTPHGFLIFPGVALA